MYVGVRYHVTDISSVKFIFCAFLVSGCYFNVQSYFFTATLIELVELRLVDQRNFKIFKTCIVLI